MAAGRRLAAASARRGGEGAGRGEFAMIIPILICAGDFLALLAMLRQGRLSLGLPLAYLALLLLIHVPGALAHVVGEQVLGNTEYVTTGIWYTAIGVTCFVVGVWIARATTRPDRTIVAANRRGFAVFCLVGGWIFVYGLSPLSRIPSLGAAISNGGAIWMLGTLLGLRYAAQTGNTQRLLMWSAAPAVYATLMLLAGGFLSYGAAAATVIISVLAILARSYLRAFVGVAVAVVVGMTIFVNYFENRTDIRESVWGGASVENRIGSVLGMADTFHLLDLSSEKDLVALDMRLNQNLFVGLAASRLADKEVDFLNGKSVWDGFLSLVPRALWPDKPITGGSGTIVADITGLQLSEDTSWGVGNVLEFYINFGLPGVVVGFLALGWLLGTLDFRAAVAERRGDLGQLILIFLPTVGLIQPGASFVEMTGSAAAALVAAYVWRWGWSVWQSRREPARPIARAVPAPGTGHGG
jgi:hypothetical protein